MGKTAVKRASGQFRVAAMEEGKCTLESYNRRDFYKISLITRISPSGLRYGSLEEIKIDRPVLVLVSPIVPYAWSIPSRTVQTEGYFCVFNDEFIRSDAQLSGVADRLFTTQESPVCILDKAAEGFLTGLFARMRAEADMDYADKDDLFRSHLRLIFHETIQMSRTENVTDKGIQRVAANFIRLLNQQFPVDLPLQSIKLKKASDFADRIAVHVNHLNTAVQKATGKSTTTHISERLFAEAKSLLRHTDYNVAEISVGLGFEYQSYFNRFFKKDAGVTPSDYRKKFEKYK
jgi:AraC family transcriptional regulator, transcriptional activator of pobA